MNTFANGDEFDRVAAIVSSMEDELLMIANSSERDIASLLLFASHNAGACTASLGLNASVWRKRLIDAAVAGGMMPNRAARIVSVAMAVGIQSMQ